MGSRNDNGKGRDHGESTEMLHDASTGRRYADNTRRKQSL